MNLSEREELRLVLLRDASVGHFMWLDRWQVSYPQVIAAECSAHEALNLQNQRLQAAIEPEQDFPLFIVAHGAACAAACALLFHADVLLHKRIKGLILVAPMYQQWQHDADNVLKRARASFPCVVVVGENDAACNLHQAEEIAAFLGGKALQTPHQGHLDAELNGWQWGMKLVQEMILA